MDDGSEHANQDEKRSGRRRRNAGTEEDQMNERVETRTVARAMLHRWWLVVGMTVLAAAVAYGVSLAIPPVYEGTTSVMVGGAIQASHVTLDQIETSQQLTMTYADLVSRQPVLEGAVESLELHTTWQELGTRVRAELIPGNTELIEISARAGSPEEAKAIAGAVTDQLIALSPTDAQEESASLAQTRAAQLNQRIADEHRRIKAFHAQLLDAPTEAKAASLRQQISDAQRLVNGWEDDLTALSAAGEIHGVNQLEVIEQARALPTPVVPNTPFNVLIAACLGLLIGAAVAYALDARDQRRAYEPGVSDEVSPNGHDLAVVVQTAQPAPPEPVASSVGAPPPPPGGKGQLTESPPAAKRS
jgi:capsular polysaccharide biosynthesis protein